ncbi:MAG: ATP-binding protein [Acidobacteriota bacterium]
MRRCPMVGVDYKRLAQVIRMHRDRILSTWQSAVRAIPRARELDEPKLLDHIPELLDRIARNTEDLARGSSPDLGASVAEQHAVERLEEGFDVLEVIGELRVLRNAILQTFSDPGLGLVHVDEIRLLDDAIDTAIMESVDRYSQVREKRLSESEAQFRALADHIPQLAWMAGADGRIYWVNRRWSDYTGTTADDLRGNGWERVQHPDHLARVTARFQRAIATGVPWEDTFPMRGKDGHYRWFLSRAVPIRDDAGKLERWFGTNTDVTARRFLDDATRVLNHSLDYRQTLEELAHLAVPELADFCIVDLVEDGKLQHVTMVHDDEHKLELARAFVARNTYDPARHVGTRQILERGQPMLAVEITDQMLLARTHSAERQIRRELGLRSWIGAPLIARGQTIGVIHLMLSESNRRYQEADVEVVAELGRRAGAAVDNARLYRDAQQAVRVRDDVLAIVSHDLRNPLAAVDLGATLLLQRFGSDSRARKHLEMIRRSAVRMEHLIGDLLDMASINAGKFAIQPVRVDAGEVLAEVVDMHEPAAGERGIALVREHDLAGVPLLVDRSRIIQVFANLIGNALKFCKPGDAIVVRGERAGDRVRLVVSDTGPGISAVDLPHIFEPYWSGRRGRIQGAGLGLFITRAIVEAHGGEIDVSSEEGKGSTFTVTLPVAREPAATT